MQRLRFLSVPFPVFAVLPYMPYHCLLQIIHQSVYCPEVLSHPDIHRISINATVSISRHPHAAGNVLFYKRLYVQASDTGYRMLFTVPVSVCTLSRIFTVCFLWMSKYPLSRSMYLLATPYVLPVPLEVCCQI